MTTRCPHCHRLHSLVPSPLRKLARFAIRLYSDRTGRFVLIPRWVEG